MQSKWETLWESFATLFTFLWFLPTMSSGKALPRKAMLNCLHLYSVSSDNDLPRKAMFHCLYFFGYPLCEISDAV